jgi:hypothetical protein
MKEYRSFIENLADNKESMAYANSGPEHAAIIFSNIFRTSRKEVCIYAGNLASGISSRPEYLEELKCFLDRKGKLQIILQSLDQTKNPELFNLLSQYAFFDKDQISLYETTAIVEGDENKPIHFCTGDDLMYRMENDTEMFQASGSFNDPQWVTSLKNLFGKLKNVSTPALLA